VSAVTDYVRFVEKKSQQGTGSGFSPLFMPETAFDFQRSLIEWSVKMGRAAIFADCGLGKTLMQLAWAQNVHQHTNKPVLICTPLAVAGQTCKEAEKFGIEARQSKDGQHGGGIVVTNYERLQHFDETQFAGVVCDESSILKSVTGARRKRITRFMSKMNYRLLCTATAAPNDYVELGTSSEALGELSHSDMLRRFFKMLDDKGQKTEIRNQEQAERLIEADPSYYQKLAYRVAQTIGQWRLKHHAVTHFWKWVASWARACKKPSDLGFSDAKYKLPKLIETDHVIKPDKPPKGHLFNMPAFGMGEEREERRRTLDQRCGFVADLVNHDRAAVVWCHLDDEGDMLEKVIPGAVQISGRDSDDRKCEIYEAFASGQIKKLVIKPKIGAWGLNWQHCNHVVSFPSHSYEQYYQSIRRCYRFGQKKNVTVDVVATEGEIRVLGNMRAKAKRADAMFEALVQEMNSAVRIQRVNNYVNKVEAPQWLS
jgi:hypothetical protein